MKKNLCVIPARGGSKRIPRKNIRNFLGKPIISYSIEAALESNIFDEVMVSTDDEEIAGIAIKYGAVVPFFRSLENANDFATLTDVLIEVLHQYKLSEISWNILSCILPTAPFVTPDILKTAYSKMQEINADCIIPVVNFSYPIQRALQISENGILSMSNPEYLSTRSQDLPPRFHDAGQFYIIKSETLLYEKTLFPKSTSAMQIDELTVQDIDTETDWKIAEMKYQLVYGN